VKETAITRKLVDKLREAGAWVYKVHGSGMSRAGVPDLLCCYKGRFVAIEVKTDTGKVSPRQRVELAAINDAGGDAFLCQGMADVDRVVRLLRCL
jgi:Holliday junction resolvase